MPTGAGRRRHPSEVYSRDTHSGYFNPFIGGEPRPPVRTGALAAPDPAGRSMGDARDGEQSQAQDIAPRAIQGGHISVAALTRDLFAETIIPPEVLGTLPTLPDAEYPQGCLVFLTTDEKLYRNTDGSTWSVAVDGADIIASSIVAGKIAAGAIGASEIAAGAIQTSHFEATASAPEVSNSDNSVVIDPDGITISGGKIFLYDYAGSSVLGAAGFGGSWVEYIANGSVQLPVQCWLTVERTVWYYDRCLLRTLAVAGYSILGYRQLDWHPHLWHRGGKRDSIFRDNDCYSDNGHGSSGHDHISGRSGRGRE